VAPEIVPDKDPVAELLPDIKTDIVPESVATEFMVEETEAAPSNVALTLEEELIEEAILQ